MTLAPQVMPLARVSRAKPITYRVDERGCYVCTSHSSSRGGYACARRGGRVVYLHRWLYEQANGELPEDVEVRHTCDNPLCLNLQHLIPGSHQENIQDMTDRGRRFLPTGTLNGQHRLTEDDVRAIRLSANSYSIIATQFSISRHTVSAVRRRLIWRHVI